MGVAGVLWLAAICAAPVAVESSHRALSIGAAGIYAAGHFVCHQIPDRCFHVDGRPMPVCARCTGLYASAAVAAPLALLLSWNVPPRRARRLLFLAALPTILTWSIEYAGFAHFSNGARFAAALPLGLAAAWLVIGVTDDR